MNKIRWGIIGTGDVAARKGGPALYMAERSELVAVTNRTHERAEQFSNQHGRPRVYRDIEALLADRDVDAVYVATPPDSHADLTCRIAAQGKHVLCEKPMALSFTECDRMVAACEEHQVSLAVAYYRRFFPVVGAMEKLLRDGAIGTPLRISVRTAAQFRSDVTNPWRLQASIAGGGFLMDMGSHRFDLMAHFFGLPQCTTAIVRTQTAGRHVDDAATVAFEFADGVLGSAEFHWNSPIGRDTLEIMGTHGAIMTDSLSDAGRLTLETSLGKELWRLPAEAPVHLRLVQAFVDHLLDGTPNPLPGTSGKLATQMLEAAYGHSD